MFTRNIGLQNKNAKIGSLLICQQQTYQEKNQGDSLIHNSLKIKTKQIYIGIIPTKESKGLDSENFKILKLRN